MTEEERTERTPEPEPGLEPEAVAELQPEPAPAPEPEPKPETVGVRVNLLIETNENLKALATLWGETKTQTAWKLLTGAVQHHYSVNRMRGRL